MKLPQVIDKVVAELHVVTFVDFEVLSVISHIKIERINSLQVVYYPSTVTLISSRSAVSRLTRKWDSVAKLFLLHVERFSWWLWRSSLLWLSLFFPRALHNSAGLSSCLVTLLLLECRKVFREREPLLLWSQLRCVRVFSPLGPPHHHTHDPCASNVNNPAFPESCEIPRDSTWKLKPPTTPPWWVQLYVIIFLHNYWEKKCFCPLKKMSYTTAHWIAFSESFNFTSAVLICGWSLTDVVVD